MVVVFVVVVVVVALDDEDAEADEDDEDDEDAADDELPATVCDGVSVCVGSSDGVLISETRAGSPPPGCCESPDASDPTWGAST
ncbi:hypothetical protein [Lentzea jiangxiensis]|uniref:Uncharacterized protein n=1 Tax=Lentzea jiangxiensis TaxID=641025 RepID=A0A1H0VF65_9PSEU|nr:hypothetical protein [Lentzea jiangxiensis]SDP77127.1 hypothetical protein SAMN05421507_11492 [Lentzea jiangxiensis]